jgi:hypothetical protein
MGVAARLNDYVQPESHLSYRCNTQICRLLLSHINLAYSSLLYVEFFFHSAKIQRYLFSTQYLCYINLNIVVKNISVTKMLYGVDLESALC